jgi:hypothetical protein
MVNMQALREGLLKRALPLTLKTSLRRKLLFVCDIFADVVEKWL